MSSADAYIDNDDCRTLNALRQTPELFERLNELEGSELSKQSALRKLFPDELVRAAMSLHELRQRAAGRFTRADQMWLDRQGLEQATTEAVATYKAKRFDGPVWDLCCGIGSDTIALAARNHVTAVDLNPAACLRTQWNAEVYDVASRIETRCQDVTQLIRFETRVHIDPDRRPGAAGRVWRLEDCIPGLADLRRLIDNCPGGAIKVSPASNFGGKFPQCEIELISLHGECKEATVWFGDLAGSAPFRATVLPTGETIAGHPLDILVAVAPIGRYLYDPDPAIVRAGLVDLVADRLGLRRLDRAEEYLTSDELVVSPFAQPFEVLGHLPNNERDLKAWLRTSDIGSVEIKCRHIPIQADALRRRLPLDGTGQAVLIIARLDGKARIVTARRPAAVSSTPD